MGKVKYKTSAQNEWNERTDLIKPQKAGKPFFHELLYEQLKNGQGKTCIELGAIPGNYLVYFHSLGYRVAGLDFADNAIKFEETMKINGIKKYKFIKAEIMSYQVDTQYDLVASFGFIEHFDNLEGILSKHIDLVAPGGLLLITVPNFRYIQWLYHRVFDADNLSIHNIDAMRPGRIHGYLTKNGLRMVENKTYGRAEFWYEDAQKNTFLGSLRNRVTARLNTTFGKINNGKMTAPYQVYLYKKV